MADIFEWDEAKAHANLAKHGVSFEEAKTVFDDPFSLTALDTRQLVAEERWFELGYSKKGRLLAVWYTERDRRIRIIGSRGATANERRRYEQ